MAAYLRLALCGAVLVPLWGQQTDLLPGTARWDFPPDIAAEQHDELRRYFEGRIAAAAETRSQYWTSPNAVEQNRAEFRRIIGAVDSFLPPKPKIKTLSETAALRFSLVEWPVLPLGNSPATLGSSGAIVTEYGVLLESKRPGKHPAVVAIADANISAADISGITTRLPQREQFARSMAVNGYIVFAPFFTQRRTFSLPWTEDRDWLVRLGYQVGRHLNGSEVQQVSSAIDFLQAHPSVDHDRIGVAGSGQGGLTALYSAALDTRIKSTLVAQYFDKRDHAFDEPEDRTIWTHLDRFGDAEIAAMIAPRPLLIDRGGPEVQPEFDRARGFYAKAGAAEAIRYIGERDQQFGPTSAALERFDEVLGPDVQWFISPPQPAVDPDVVAAISNAQFAQWQARYRNLAMEAYSKRDERWKPDTRSVDAYQQSIREKRELFFDTIGRLPQPSGSFDAKSIQVYDEPEFRGYRLSVRMYDGVHAYGILLVPKNLKPGERRPLVFTQHGFGGKPEDALGVVENSRADGVYSKFGRDLARRGYIVFAPHISAQTTAARNALVRRAHLTGVTPVAAEIQKESRLLDFFETLPFVDKNRFGFYGLSYGGFMALWTGPAEPRFKVLICSGYFNDWNLKSTDLTEGTSFLFYKDTFDMFNFDMLNRFNHSDLASLVPPRAFMVEIGSRDGIVMDPRRFPEAEIARVTDLYRKLGIPNKGRVARFDGPHKIDGREAFAFLDEVLGWKSGRN